MYFFFKSKWFSLPIHLTLIFFFFKFQSPTQIVEATFIPELSDDDWDVVLYDQWMILFCASWHPACKHFSSTWHRFSLLQNDYLINLAYVNFTNHPDLSARFLISKVPTLVHSFHGTFRKLDKIPSDYFEIGRFLQKESWKNLDPIPTYLAPNTFQMTIVSDMINYMMHNSFIKDVHQTLVKRYFLPFWSYYPFLILFYTATLILYGSFVLLFLILTRIKSEETFSITNETNKFIKRSIINLNQNYYDSKEYKPNEKLRFLSSYKFPRYRKNAQSSCYKQNINYFDAINSS